MKAVLCERLEGPDALVLRDVDDPRDPGEHEVSVDVLYRSLSFTDILMSRGEYHVHPNLPFVVGGEGVGRVARLGAGVKNFREGDLVLAGAGCVEKVVVNASSLTALPPDCDLKSAASFRANYQTALVALQRGRLQAGEVLLVHGSAGGVGLAAVDLGKLMGATVIATASTDEKLEVVKEYGADHVINYSNGFRDEVKELTDDRGADVIYDPVGGEVFEQSMRCIAPFGRILIVGFTSGRAALAKTNHLLVKDAELIGFTIGGFARHAPEKSAKNFHVLLGWLASKRIRPYVSHVVPMSNVPEGLKLIIDRKVIGKVVVAN